MAYSTTSHILASLDPKFAANLADDSAGTDTEGEVPAAIIAQMITDADSLIDSYIGTRYVVPVTVVIPSLRRASVSIAIYYLHMRRSWSVTPEIKQAYDDSVAWLEKVAAGKAEISTAAAPVADSPALASSFEADTRIFTHDGMQGF